MNISPESSKPAIAASIGILVSFFMSWVLVIGTFPFSAFRLGTQFSNYYLWIIPLLAITTIFISLNGSNNRSIAAITGIVSICTVEVLVGNVLESPDRLLFGAWFTILCSIIAIVASFIDMPQIRSASFKRLPDNIVWIPLLIGGLIGAKIGSMIGYGLTGTVFGVLIAHFGAGFTAYGLANSTLRADTKTCPYCAEEVKVEAIVCKHCGNALNKNIHTTTTNPAKSMPPEELSAEDLNRLIEEMQSKEAPTNTAKMP